jgi:uncharacterized membrane protein
MIDNIINFTRDFYGQKKGIMKKLGVLMMVGLLLASFTLSGCGGRKQTTTVQSTSTTLGQELVDLQQAYDKGIITEKEYNDLKQKAMKKYK